MTTMQAPERSGQATPPRITEVSIKHIDIGFFELSGFLLKLVLAAIPAMIIVAILGAAIGAFLAALGVAAIGGPRF